MGFPKRQLAPRIDYSDDLQAGPTGFGSQTLNKTMSGTKFFYPPGPRPNITKHGRRGSFNSNFYISPPKDFDFGTPEGSTCHNHRPLDEIDAKFHSTKPDMMGDTMMASKGQGFSAKKSQTHIQEIDNFSLADNQAVKEEQHQRAMAKKTPMEILENNLKKVKAFREKVNMDIESFAVPLSKVESRGRRIRRCLVEA